MITKAKNKRISPEDVKNKEAVPPEPTKPEEKAAEEDQVSDKESTNQ